MVCKSIFLIPDQETQKGFLYENKAEKFFGFHPGYIPHHPGSPDRTRRCPSRYLRRCPECHIRHLQADHGTVVQPCKKFQNPYTKTVSRTAWMHHRFSWHCQRPVVFSQSISGSVRLSVHRINRRHASLSFSGSRTAGPFQRLLDCHGSMYVYHIPSPVLPLYPVPSDQAQSFLVPVLRILPGPQHDRTRDEFFHTSYAPGSLYSFYRRNRTFHSFCSDSRRHRCSRHISLPGQSRQCSVRSPLCPGLPRHYRYCHSCNSHDPSHFGLSEAG